MCFSFQKGEVGEGEGAEVEEVEASVVAEGAPREVGVIEVEEVEGFVEGEGMEEVDIGAEDQTVFGE